MTKVLRTRSASFPARFKSCAVKLYPDTEKLESSVTNKAKLILTWVLDHYILDKRVDMITTINESMSFEFLQTKVSWNQASELCKEMGGLLPYFTSRQDLEDLLIYFKIRGYLIPWGVMDPKLSIQAVVEIYIGLKYYSNDVSHKLYLLLDNMHN